MCLLRNYFMCQFIWNVVIFTWIKHVDHFLYYSYIECSIVTHNPPNKTECVWSSVLVSFAVYKWSLTLFISCQWEILNCTMYMHVCVCVCQIFFSKAITATHFSLKKSHKLNFYTHNVLFFGLMETLCNHSVIFPSVCMYVCVCV